MKKYIKILLLIIISLTIQTAILFYINNYYLVDDYEVTFTQEEPEAPVEETVKIKLPNDAKNIKLSPTGKYIHYLSSDTIHVVNLESGRDNSVDLSYNIINYYFRWHDYEDKLIITERNPESGGNAIRIYTYKARDDIKIAALDFNNEIRSYQLSTPEAAVSDLQLNTLNTIMYIKATNNEGTSYINRLDISSGINRIPLGKDNIGRFYINKKDDELVFEDSTNQRVYRTNKSSIEDISVAVGKSISLLEVDKNDNIYVGELKDGLIKAIVYNKVKNTEWASIQLPHLAAINDIFIFGSDKIFIVNRDNSTVKDINNNKEISFEGKFIDMNSSQIISVNDQNAIVTKLEQATK